MSAARVAILTLGCKVNAYDTATIAERLRAAAAASSRDDARGRRHRQLVHVTDAADAESRRLARRARRTNPAARVVLTGCYAQTQPAGGGGGRRPSTTSSA